MAVKHLLKLLLPAKWRHKIREHYVSMNVNPMYGPQNIRLSSNEAVVTCVVKNGEFYIEQFIRHYTQMGFRHIFFLDNGSTDQTIPIAKRHKNVSVCRCSLPIDAHQGLFKKYLAKKAAKGGWCLDADIDEFFDYPFSDVIGLHDFLDYLNRKNYTAVITHLLDMFSDKPASHLANKQEENLKVAYQHYDISEVTKTKYHGSEIVAAYGQENDISNGNSELYWGGIRKVLYGNDCLLTKHSLFRVVKELELFPHVHFVNNARLADVSCLMYHYKLTSNALETAVQNRDKFITNSSGYADFINFLAEKPDYQIRRNTAVKLGRVNDLVDNGFLFTSEEYNSYAMALAKGTP